MVLAAAGLVLLLSFCLEIRGRSDVGFPGTPSLPEFCTMRRYLGIGCPGCGLTRCFISITQGQFREAWAFNPVGILLYLIIIFQIPYRLFQLGRLGLGYAAWEIPALYYCLALIAIGLPLQWVWRLFS